MEFTINELRKQLQNHFDLGSSFRFKAEWVDWRADYRDIQVDAYIWTALGRKKLFTYKIDEAQFLKACGLNKKMWKFYDPILGGKSYITEKDGY
jgi:hypothetical protein